MHFSARFPMFATLYFSLFWVNFLTPARGYANPEPVVSLHVSVKDSLEAAAATGPENALDQPESSVYDPSSQLIPTLPSGVPREKPSSSARSYKKKRSKKRLFSWFSLPKVNLKFLELDWLAILIVILLPAALVSLIYFLTFGATLSFFEFFLFALGLGMAVFSYLFLLSENGFSWGNYDFFVKWGILSWPGILAIVAGLVGLFGGTGGSLLGFILVGVVIGLLTFLISLIVKDSILNEIWG